MLYDFSFFKVLKNQIPSKPCKLSYDLGVLQYQFLNPSLKIGSNLT